MIVQAGEYTIDKRPGKWVITPPNKLGEITVYGNGHWHETFYAVPDWSEEEHEAFEYKGETYFLENFPMTHGTPWGDCPEWMWEFDGYAEDSFFSGLLIKFDTDPMQETAVQVWTYIS